MEEMSINRYRLLAFDILNELLVEVDLAEDYVFVKFHELFAFAVAFMK